MKTAAIQMRPHTSPSLCAACCTAKPDSASASWRFLKLSKPKSKSALDELAEKDSDFAAQLETEFTREENDVFCGLFVKNLENVQGDERDIIIMSVCYGHDANGRMLMNFGPINQSRRRKTPECYFFPRQTSHGDGQFHSPQRHHQRIQRWREQPEKLPPLCRSRFPKAMTPLARRVLENLNPLSRKSLAPQTTKDAVVDKLAEALRARGYIADTHVGQSKFRCDIAVRQPSQPLYELAILVDTDVHYANQNVLDRYLLQPGVLRAFGWRSTFVLTKDWYHQPEEVLARLEKLLQNNDPATDEELEEVDPAIPPEQPLDQAPPAKTETKSEPVPAVTQPSNPKSMPSQVRRFELIGGGSKKFWEIGQSGPSINVRFGRIGTTGQEQTKSFPDASAAAREVNRLIAEKIKKGYTEIPK